MKDKILEKSQELFLNLGFKSVTMDEIANSLGISKKTLYKHYSNKTQLVEEVTDYLFDNICCEIDSVYDLNLNPIEELFEIKKVVLQNLKDEKSSPQYQLQKYYPKIYFELKNKQFEVMQGSIKENLNTGINLNLYRAEIDIEFISRLYFHGLIGVRDRDLFPLQQYSMNNLITNYLDYHLRGIATEKGIEELENQLNKQSVIYE
ncbi:TetR/AcrR family transcriptional regulator [Polaribacter dokdonensis]|uniref:Regulatory protein, TetR family n=1 Tax=Polaribacter dokdonensis DSW-5 TaxID=1300348 RepID=A0A0N0CFC6_9FLAO|nr:TetR/AcrR family transcriptional regulator [Polaribacter dokdonensis]KOY51684.1 Regulatory protein, TetR family [Polaribacter dokdonensis DSW-5]SEE05624.1 transcriptional regulator, TetR family [Polaribacter dokdonensis DSW-5]